MNAREHHSNNVCMGSFRKRSPVWSLGQTQRSRASVLSSGPERLPTAKSGFESNLTVRVCFRTRSTKVRSHRDAWRVETQGELSDGCVDVRNAVRGRPSPDSREYAASVQ